MPKPTHQQRAGGRLRGHERREIKRLQCMSHLRGAHCQKTSQSHTAKPERLIARRPYRGSPGGECTCGLGLYPCISERVRITKCIKRLCKRAASRTCAIKGPACRDSRPDVAQAAHVRAGGCRRGTGLCRRAGGTRAAVHPMRRGRQNRHHRQTNLAPPARRRWASVRSRPPNDDACGLSHARLSRPEGQGRGDNQVGLVPGRAVRAVGERRAGGAAASPVGGAAPQRRLRRQHRKLSAAQSHAPSCCAATTAEEHCVSTCNKVQY